MNSNGAELKGNYKEAEHDEFIGKPRLRQTLFFSGNGEGLIKLSFN